MAEINVERRERSMAPWLIIGALLLIALLWWLLSGNNERDNVAAVTDTTGVVAPGAMGTADPAAATMTPESGTGSMGTAAQPAAVSTFLSYVDERSTQGAVGLDHEYTANGLRQLADAIG